MGQDDVQVNPYSPPAAPLAVDGRVPAGHNPGALAFLVVGFATSLVIRPGILVDPLRESVLSDPGVEAASRGLMLAVGSLPWLLAPILAFLSDIALWKVERRSWLLLAAGTAFLLWPLLAVVAGQKGFLLAVQSALVLSVVLFWVAQWGMAAEIGRSQAATGAVGGTCVAAQRLTLSLVVLLGSALGGLGLVEAAVLACGVLLVFGLSAVRTLRRERVAPGALLEGRSAVLPAFSRSSFLITGLLLLLLDLASSGVKSHLQLKSAFQGGRPGPLAGPGWSSHLIVGLGGIAYVWLCRRVALHWLLLMAVGGTAAAAALIFAEGLLPGSWIAEARWSLLGLSSVPLLDLALRVVRPGREALGFTLLQGCSALGSGVGPMLAGLTVASGLASLTVMAVLFAVVLAALFLVFLLPPELGQVRDGEVPA